MVQEPGDERFLYGKATFNSIESLISMSDFISYDKKIL